MQSLPKSHCIIFEQPVQENGRFLWLYFCTHFPLRRRNNDKEDDTMKLPNGYGSVTKLTGKRRKPYMARITDGRVYDDSLQGYKLNRRVLGYYATKKEALQAIAAYNQHPYAIADNSITFGQIYDRWQKRHYTNLSASAIRSREAALKYCAPISDMRIRDIRTEILQNVVDLCPHGSATKKNICAVMHSVYEYAMQNNLADRDYADFISIEKSEPVIQREIFSDAEIDLLWSWKSEWDVQILLILIYSGLRINELLTRPRADCNLEEEWIYVSKAKNKSSIRYVPIHSKIMPFVKHFYDQKSEWMVCTPSGSRIWYADYNNRRLPLINKRLGTDHRPHDTRHTFATLGHRYSLDDLTLKKIMGHTPDNITQKVYTHISIGEMRQEIEKIV